MPRRRKEELGDAYFISKSRTAQILGVSKGAVENLITQKILVTYQFGKQVKVGRHSVHEFAENPDKFKPKEYEEELQKPFLKIENQNKHLLQGVFKSNNSYNNRNV